MDSSHAGQLADLILVAHVGVVLFVVLGELLFLIGGMRHWAWVRHFGVRVTHLVLMVFIAVQALMGQLCPLTIWEQSLRAHAGANNYSGGFIEHGLSKLLYWQAPPWVFLAVYLGFAVLVVITWFVVPARRR
jgi:hypothetical protein